MATWDSEAKIAAAYNNAAGLTLVTALVTSPVIPFQEPKTVPYTWRGVRRVSAGTGQIRRAGFKRLEWRFDILWVVQYMHLVSTFEATNSGQVTIRTTFNNITWANYNAVIDCGDLGDYGQVLAETQYGLAIPQYVLRFSRVEGI